jgi:hypothetical protein
MLVKLIGAKGHVHHVGYDHIVAIRPSVSNHGSVLDGLVTIDLVKGPPIVVNGTPDSVRDDIESQLKP